MWFKNLFGKKYLGTAHIPTWRTYRKSISQIGYNIERDWVRATMIGINILDEAEQRKKIDAKVENNFKEKYYKEYPIIKAFQDEILGQCRTEKLEEFLKEGVDPNFPIWYNKDNQFNLYLKTLGLENYPIHIAVKKKNLQAVKLLCQYGSAVNFQNADSLLAEAAKNNDCEMAEYLLKQHADVNYRPFIGCEPMYEAIKHQSEKMISLFLRYGFKEEKGDYLLQAAVYADAVQIIPFLEKNLHQSSEKNNKALIVAARVGQFEIARLLIEYKADVNYREPFRSFALKEALFIDNDCKDKEKIIREKEKIIRLLLAHGADANATDENNKPLLYTLLSDINGASYQMARILLDAGARFDLAWLPQIEKELNEKADKKNKSGSSESQTTIQEKMRLARKRNRRIYAYYLFRKVNHQNSNQIVKVVQNDDVLNLINDLKLLPLLYTELDYTQSCKVYDINIQKIKNLSYDFKVKIRQNIRKKHFEHIRN